MADKESEDRRPLKELFLNSRAALFLKKIGYRYIHIVSPYIVLRGESSLADLNINPASSLNEFEYILLKNTILRLLFEKTPLINKTKKHAKAILNTLEYFKKSVFVKEPFFFLAHIICPHPPFVFNETGEIVHKEDFFLLKDGSHWMEFYGNRDEYITAYRGQIEFLNKKVIEAVDFVLKNSKNPPIIILQADHGPGAMLEWESYEKTNLKERIGILNAYYLPAGGDALLYSSISPVNTFRVIFNYYFGANYEILEDKSYFSTWSKPYNFLEASIK